MKIIYSYQWNDRKEFDIRRGGRSDDPAVLMLQNQHYFSSVFENEINKKLKYETGIQYINISNRNDNEATGRMPLIPHYNSNEPSVFFVIKNQKQDFLWEAGLRYSYLHRDVINISADYPRVLEYEEDRFHNFGLSSGFSYQWNKFFNSNFDIGMRYRSPEVNELYSFGVHQSVSSYEIGDKKLKTEKSIKAVMKNRLKLTNSLHLSNLTYLQAVNDFIYLQPSNDTVTIRGRYRVYRYMQADSYIYGFDTKVSFEPTKHIKFNSSFSIVRGYNREEDLFLVNIPADNLTNSVNFLFKNNAKFQNSQLSLFSKHVARQHRISVEDGQDFYPPPKGYFTVGLKGETTFEVHKLRTNVYFSLENALNRNYRDYLNRMRYFANDIGRNLTIGMSCEF